MRDLLLTVLGACGYLWLCKPEHLTWWKRSVGVLIEGGFSQLLVAAHCTALVRPCP
jgi:hypothetical protein